MRKIIPCILLFLYTSCKKTTEATPIIKENIAGAWQLTAKWMSATGIPEQDAFPNMEECEKDNLYFFNGDYSFTYEDSGIACEMSEPFCGSWELHEKEVTFMGQTGSVTKFDGTYMEVTIQVTDAKTETTYTIKCNFKKV